MLSKDEEDRIRAVLKHCQTSGADPVYALNRMALVRTNDHVVQVRKDTLNAAADLIDGISPSSLPHEASVSPFDMKTYLSWYLRDLAGKQTHGSQNATEASEEGGKQTASKKKKAKDRGN